MDVVEDKIDPASPLEDELHVHNEGVVHLKHDESFQIDALNRVFVQYHVLPDALESVVSLRRREVSEIHLAEGTPAYHRYQLELLEGELVALGAPGVEELGLLETVVLEAAPVENLLPLTQGRERALFCCLPVLNLGLELLFMLLDDQDFWRAISDCLVPLVDQLLTGLVVHHLHLRSAIVLLAGSTH